MKNLLTPSRYWLLASVLLVQANVLAQTTTTDTTKKVVAALTSSFSDALKNALPLSIKQNPEAAAFTKFTEVPISHYTGVPNISIPLYTLSGLKVSLPITLNYHASGIKAEEEASQVGLGWSLDAGGMISRSVQGRDDFDGILRQNNTNQNAVNNLLNPAYAINPNMYWHKYDKIDQSLSPAVSMFLFCVPSATQTDPSLHTITKTMAAPLGGSLEVGKPPLDSQYDLFTFKAGAYTGKFIITLHQSPYKIYILNQEPIRVELLPNSSLVNTADLSGKSGFKITTPDGNQYFYQLTESSRSVGGSSNCGKIEYPDTNPNTAGINSQFNLSWDNNGTAAGDAALSPVITNWYLTKIVSADTPQDSITFQYSRTKEFSAIPLCSRVQSLTLNSAVWRVTDTRHQLVHLMGISSKMGKVVFSRSSRNDIRAIDGNAFQKIDKITIQNTDGEAIGGYQFNYGYFDSGDATRPLHTRQRLRLEGLNEIGNNNNTNPPYLWVQLNI